MSAFTILFLLTITHLTRKLVRKGESELTVGQTIAVIGSGVGSVGLHLLRRSGSLPWGKSRSSMLTALVFWLILKWDSAQASIEQVAVLIAYVIGLSIGVHLLNLLCIPAIVLVYYFQKIHPLKEFCWH